MGTRIHFRAGGQDGRGMNARGEDWFRKKQRQDLRKGNARVRHADQYLSAGSKRAVNNHSGGGALVGAREIAFVLGEREVARLSAVSRGETFENQGGVARHLTTNVLGDFRSGKGHKGK